MNQLRSPVPWQGGKHYSAQFILSQFPAPTQYDVFADIFGGGANILLTKPVGKHLEVYNDIHNNLVNFWLQCRDNAEMLQQRCDSLPYSRSLYYAYHKSLFDGTEMTDLERATRWFYVLNSSFRASVDETPNGWSCGVTGLHRGQVGGYKGHLHAKSYRNTVEAFVDVAARFRNIEIDCRDFEEVVKQYEQPYGLRTLIYADPPYIDSEHYYKPSKDTDYTMFHQRLARVLNAMTEHKFKPGDRVRNTSTGGPYYEQIKGKIGVYQRPWDEQYTLRNACDVRYRGVTDLYGREDIAQSEDDLELVELDEPSLEKPFSWWVNGRVMRVHAEFRTCGHKQTRDTSYIRCINCYPPSGTVRPSHGPYYYGLYREQGKQHRVYIGRELPPLDLPLVKEA